MALRVRYASTALGALIAAAALAVPAWTFPAAAHEGDEAASSATGAPASAPGSTYAPRPADVSAPDTAEELPPPPTPYLLPSLDLPRPPRPVGITAQTGTLVMVASGSSDHVIAPLLMTAGGRSYSLVGSGLDDIAPGSTVAIKGTTYPRGSISSLLTASRSDIAVTSVTVVTAAPVMTGSSGTRKVFIAALSWPDMPADSIVDRNCDDVSWLAAGDLCQTAGINGIEEWSQAASDGVFDWDVTVLDLSLPNQPACDDYAWREATITAATGEGYDIVNGGFSALALLMPSGVTCIPTAYAYVGAGTWNVDPWWSLSVYGYGYSFKQVLVHELGHSLGLPHANNATCTQSSVAVSMSYYGSCEHHEYGDAFDPMGSAFTSTMYNPIFARDLGWTPASDRISLMPFSNGQAAGSESVTLAGYANISGGLRVADIELPPPTTGQLAGQSPGTLYVEYKQETGIDSSGAWNWWNPPENKVYLHWRPSCPYATHLSLDCSVSYLIDTVPATTDVEDGGLAPGESWIDPTSTLTVSVTSRASDLSSATITFEWTSSTPSAPAGISLERTASGTVRVAWSAAIAHGNTVRGYRVRASGDGGQQCTTTVGVTDNPLTCEVSGLTNGVSYTFDITASSDMGAGPAATSAVTVAAAPPTAPTSVSAARSGSGALQVSWEVPQNSGGVDLSSYRVTSVTGGKSCTVTAAPGAQPARTCTVTGLTNGTSYQFRVSATNTAGLTSDQSVASTALTPATSPGSPTSVSLTRVGSGALKVSWKAPSSTGGVAVTSYSARSAVGGRSCTAVAPATSCTVAGLTNGTSYRFQVVATNAAALASVASALSPSLAPGIAPGAPSAPSATRASATSIKVTWKAPSATGGLPLTGFTVTVSGSSRGCSGGATATSCTVTGLTRWTTHKVAVTARNDAGSSRVSAWSAPITLW